MEDRMKNSMLYFKKLLQHSTERDLVFLLLIVFFVSNTMPISIMGDEDFAHYFFSERNTKVIKTVEYCLSEYRPCEVELNANSRLSVTMPAQVLISEAFDVSATVTGPGVERITVNFIGVDHSHGLLPQAMSEIKSGHYHAKGSLSYCGYQKMDWRALVTVYTERTIYETSFTFKSVDSRVDLAGRTDGYTAATL